MTTGFPPLWFHLPLRLRSGTAGSPRNELMPLQVPKLNRCLDIQCVLAHKDAGDKRVNIRNVDYCNNELVRRSFLVIVGTMA